MRVLMILDEFANLGSLDAIRNAMSMARGYGVSLFPIVQDLSQLAELYPRSWETFVANAAVRMFFAPRDQKTSEYLSSLCGQTEHRSPSQSITTPDAPGSLLKRLFSLHPERYAPSPGSVTRGCGSGVRPLMQPHECRQLPGDEMLLFVEGINGVIRAKRRPYWEEPEFKGCYGKNPYFK